MEFNVKKFAAEAATAFSRAVQYTEEKLGSAEKTELDAHFENLQQRSDRTKYWTERILKQTELVLQPNPNLRIEEFVYEKLDKKPRERSSNLEILGQSMIEAGNDFGPGTAYGSALIKCGASEQKLGLTERELVSTSAHQFLTPLRKFLDGDMKTIMKERKILENKRLDLDACKSRLRKARSQEAQSNVSISFYFFSSCLSKEMIEKAEAELRIAQTEFDRQAEITKLLLEGISSTHASHLRCLQDFVEAQAVFYANCHKYMIDLQKELASFLGPPSSANAFSSSILSTSLSDDDINRPKTRRARVLYDYDAGNSAELSLLADEVITVSLSPSMDSDWMMGQRGSQTGKVPVAYLELLN